MVVARVDSLALRHDSTILRQKWSVVKITCAEDQTGHFQGPLLGANCVPYDCRDAGHLLYILRQGDLHWFVRVGEIHSIGDGCDVQHDVSARETIPNHKHSLVFERRGFPVLVAVCDTAGKALQTRDWRDERFAVMSAVWCTKRGDHGMGVGGGEGLDSYPLQIRT